MVFISILRQLGGIKQTDLSNIFLRKFQEENKYDNLFAKYYLNFNVFSKKLQKLDVEKKDIKKMYKDISKEIYQNIKKIEEKTNIKFFKYNDEKQPIFIYNKNKDRKNWVNVHDAIFQNATFFSPRGFEYSFKNKHADEFSIDVDLLGIIRDFVYKESLESSKISHGDHTIPHKNGIKYTSEINNLNSKKVTSNKKHNEKQNEKQNEVQFMYEILKEYFEKSSYDLKLEKDKLFITKSEAEYIDNKWQWLDKKFMEIKSKVEIKSKSPGVFYLKDLSEENYYRHGNDAERKIFFSKEYILKIAEKKYEKYTDFTILSYNQLDELVSHYLCESRIFHNKIPLSRNVENFPSSLKLIENINLENVNSIETELDKGTKKGINNYLDYWLTTLAELHSYGSQIMNRTVLFDLKAAYLLTDKRAKEIQKIQKVRNNCVDENANKKLDNILSQKNRMYELENIIHDDENKEWIHGDIKSSNIVDNFLIDWENSGHGNGLYDFVRLFKSTKLCQYEFSEEEERDYLRKYLNMKERFKKYCGQEYSVVDDSFVEKKYFVVNAIKELYKPLFEVYKTTHFDGKTLTTKEVESLLVKEFELGISQVKI
jgi:hypothetical protein